jgi:glyoxylase-like metal-dependent hydrolase (beta-lactamase superfamily II)
MLCAVGATIHHLGCGSMCPAARRLLNDAEALQEPAGIICHVLLIEGADGLTLVDTGFGTEDVRGPRRVHRGFRIAMRPQLHESETAVSRLRALGFDATDVRHVVVTHLDIDHSGGLPDFPDADVHVFARELEVMRRPPVRERVRYAISAPHWAHGPRWVEHRTGGDEWLGFASVRVLEASGADVLMIPLPGHTLGHTAVAVRRGDGWLLHCGDAYFNRHEVQTPPSCPSGLRLFQTLVEADRRARLENQERLRELVRAHGDEVELICAHDPVTLARLQAA